MFSFISKVLLNSKLRKRSAEQKKFLPWDTIQKIALIIHKDAGVNKSAIDRFISDTKKFVEVFYIETKSKQASYADWICFLSKDRSFFNLPKKIVEASLQNKSYDLVINTCKGGDFFSAAISSALKAPFKCASSSRFHDADLIIRRTDPNNVGTFLDDTVKYLKMIRV